jgi:hypothetical protein
MVTPDRPSQCPPELAAGATRFTVRPGFTGLHWTNVAKHLSSAGRDILRRDFVPVAVETFTGTTPDFWNDCSCPSHLGFSRSSTTFVHEIPCEYVLFRSPTETTTVEAAWHSVPLPATTFRASGPAIVANSPASRMAWRHVFETTCSTRPSTFSPSLNHEHPVVPATPITSGRRPKV